MEISLTDDEILAICAQERLIWPLGIVTVSVGDDAELERAIFRGIRSLVVRRLVALTAEGLDLDAEVRQLVIELVRANQLVELRAGLPGTPLGEMSGVLGVGRSGERGAIVAMPSPQGVTALTRRADDQALELLEKLASVYTHPLDKGAESEVIVGVVVDWGGPSAVVLHGRTLQFGPVGGVGRDAAIGETQPVNWHGEVVKRILDSSPQV